MSEAKWHNGTPPSIGWWPASFGRNKDSIRWQDGKLWSDYALPHYSAKEAAGCAAVMNISKQGVEWTERWWL